MKDEHKSKKELIDELVELRHRIAELEASYTDYEVGEVPPEAPLTGSEQEYESRIEEAPIAICNMDTEGRITYVNKRFEEISGYSQGEIVEKYKFNFGMFPPETLRTFSEEIKKGLNNKDSLLLETQFKRKDGKWIWVEMEARAIKKEGELECFQLASRDVTERKRREVALRESEEGLRTVFEYAPDAYFIYDTKGVFVDLNKATERITGYMKHELIGKNILTSKFIPSEQITKAAEALAKNAMGKACGPDEFILNRKDGTQVVVEIKSFPKKNKNGTLVLGIARDITVKKRAEETLQKVHDEVEKRVEERTALLSSTNELLNREVSRRKRAEEKMKEREADYLSLLEVIEQGYYEVDRAGNLTFFNDSLCEICGYTRDEMTGMNYRRLVKRENAKNVYQAFNETYTTGVPAKEFDCDIRRKDGAKRHITASIYLMKDTEGHRVGFRGAVRDLEETKEIESDIKAEV